MELEKAKERLLSMKNQLDECVKRNAEIDDSGIDDNISTAIETVIAELHAMQNLLDEKNDELEHLQKENEELKHAVVGIDLDNTYISKDELRKMKANIQMMANGNKVIENTIKYRVQMSLLDDLLKEEDINV